MQLDNLDTKQNLLNRLKRIEGQVRGVEGMVENSRDCREILQQLTAIRSAVNGATLTFLQEYVTECLLAPENGEYPQHQREIIQEAINLLGKAQ